MEYFSKAWRLLDNYLIARWCNRPSAAQFWYLPEPPNILSKHDLTRYQQSRPSPLYLMDYRKKLSYSLENDKGIIVLPYEGNIGNQINPEAAFQYALGLHDQFTLTKYDDYAEKFWRYANYFLTTQSADGGWGYHFDWFGSKAPWHSALAQTRGASVMLRAWLLSRDQHYLEAAKKAVHKLQIPTSAGGFMHTFKPAACSYFEEYPQTPTGVINGFMASLISLYELQYWIDEAWLKELWQTGIASLQSMLPYYSTGWWSLYDLDANTPVHNVNSPRYHLLEMNYLKVLSILSDSSALQQAWETRVAQYQRYLSRLRALTLKCARKILYK